MARYERSFSGEHRTRSVGVKLTPAERAGLETAASEQGTHLSEYIRNLCLHRAPVEVAVTRRNPDAKALLSQLIAIGNNLNQIARRANIQGELPADNDISTTLELLKTAIARVLAL